MRRIAFLFVLLFLFACDDLEKKKLNSEELLKQELQTFNWNDVDTYPTFDSCDSITVKAESKACFQNTLIGHVTQYLQSRNIVVSKDVDDVLSIQIVIDRNGDLEVQSIDAKPETLEQIPEIDSLLRESLRNIPKIYPALKRGQQVSTAFELPVIVRIE
ncbi:hypothetical protein [Winogradskyella aurantia]|uniref:TonB C-terminal domain-containing protein n=1 Tax=Winogradskyella aurantia TaxID=1915063 RepID=A0A265UWA9_9FLAO|nr:hypothetical protein [Winogradskyella aurantia]OZV69367.1 hypothetical protein CA834_07910 [Winogradskyella aurantia]